MLSRPAILLLLVLLPPARSRPAILLPLAWQGTAPSGARRDFLKRVVTKVGLGATPLLVLLAIIPCDLHCACTDQHIYIICSPHRSCSDVGNQILQHKMVATLALGLIFVFESKASAKDMVADARAHVEDSASVGASVCPDTARLASLGGKHGKNAARDLMRWMKRESPIAVDPYWVETVVWDPYSLGETPMNIPVYLPHELINAVYDYGAFDHLFRGESPSDVGHFWESVQRAPWFHRHPACQTPDLLPWTIPVRFHGDDAAFKSLQNTKLLIFSLHGELCRLPSVQSRLLCWVIKDRMVVPGKTLVPLLSVMKWSLNLALQKYWPSVDHLGRPLQPASGKQPGARRYQRRGSRIQNHVAKGANRHLSSLFCLFDLPRESAMGTVAVLVPWCVAKSWPGGAGSSIEGRSGVFSSRHVLLDVNCCSALGVSNMDSARKAVAALGFGCSIHSRE